MDVEFDSFLYRLVLNLQALIFDYKSCLRILVLFQTENIKNSEHRFCVTSLCSKGVFLEIFCKISSFLFDKGVILLYHNRTIFQILVLEFLGSRHVCLCLKFGQKLFWSLLLCLQL